MNHNKWVGIKRGRRLFAVGLVTGLAITSYGTGAVSAGQAARTAGAESAPSDETYYWISQGATIPIFVNVDQVGLRAAAEELGVNVEIAGPVEVDLPAFISTIDQICAQNPAGVMIIGWDAALNEAVNGCVDAGVPTVTIDADLPDSNRLAFVGTSWYDLGVALGEGMVEALGGEGEVATLSLIDAPNMIDAVQGFTDTVEATNITVVANEDDCCEAATAAEKAAALLAAYPELDGLAGFDSGSGPGIVRALQEAGKEPGEIKVVSNEGATPDFFDTMPEGYTQLITIQKRSLFTYYGLKLLVDYNHSEASIQGIPQEVTTNIPANVDTGIVIMTPENAEVIINSTREYAESLDT